MKYVATATSAVLQSEAELQVLSSNRPGHS